MLTIIIVIASGEEFLNGIQSVSCALVGVGGLTGFGAVHMVSCGK